MEVQEALNRGGHRTADAVALDEGLSVAPSEGRRTSKRRPRVHALNAGRLRRRVLLAADVIALLAACVLVSFLTASIYDASPGDALAGSAFLSAVTVLLWTGLTAVSGLYRRDERRADLTVTDDVIPIVVTVSLAQWAVLVASNLTGADIPVTLLVGLWFAAICFLVVGRTIARTHARGEAKYIQNTLIVGAGDVGQLLGRKLAHHPELGIRLVGFVDDDPRSMRRDLAEVPVLGTPAEIGALVEQHDVQRIVIAFSKEGHGRQLELVHALRNLDVQIDVVPRLFEAIGPAVGVHYVEGLPLVALQPVRPTKLARATKRVIDIAGATAALVLVSPLFLFIAWRVRRDSPARSSSDRSGSVRTWNRSSC